MLEAMGGYFELELNRGQQLYPDAVSFNSARSAFQALLLACDTRRVYLPYFICSVIPDAALAIGVEVIQYRLSEQLECIEYPELGDGEHLLFVDYFGLKQRYIEQVLAPHYRGQLIIDNSQALFSSAVPGIATLYSPRKFVGVPDGGWLINSPDNVVAPPASHSNPSLGALLGRLVDGPETHYSAFQALEEKLGHDGLQGMSLLTRRLLDNIDYPKVSRARTENMVQTHKQLANINQFQAWPAQTPPALCYPLLLDDADTATALRRKLLEQRIYVPVYWKEVIDSQTAPEFEKQFSQCLLPLPIDQRYGHLHIERLCTTVLGYLQPSSAV